MFARLHGLTLVLGCVLTLAGPARVLAQKPAAPPPPPAVGPPPPLVTAVAATVNGQPIAEIAVYRGLLREDPKNRAKARKEVLNYLIDNVIIDQYLTQLKIEVPAKDIDDRIAQIKAEAKKSAQDFEMLLKRLHLTEAELRRELAGALRWDKFVTQQGTDKALLDMFEKNKNMFDGSQVQARHILIAATAETAGQAQVKLAAIRKGIEDGVTKEVAKLPPTADNLAKEKERMKALDKAFAAAAKESSTCPSKAQGGDLGWFPRAGAMVEPFARAAFTLKPYQLSEPVITEFGYHLILAVDQKPGKEVKFEDVRPYVLEIYGERLREAVITNYKIRSKIVINEPAKDKKQ